MEPCPTLIRAVSLAAAGLFALGAAPAAAQDPAKVAGDHYKVITENDSIRLLEVNMPAGAKAVMHAHPDLAVVFLEPGPTKFTLADGKSQTPPPGARGSVIFMKAENHATESVGSIPSRVILVEFKKPAPAAGKARNPSMPAPYKQVADDARVRAFALTVPPGGSVPEHTHGDHVLVSLSDATAETTDKAGKKETVAFKKDTAMAAGPTTHVGVNTGKTPLQLVLIELK